MKLCGLFVFKDINLVLHSGPFFLKILYPTPLSYIRIKITNEEHEGGKTCISLSVF